KRTYRIMRINQLLLPRYRGRRERSHDGVVITLKSNLRWCSDVFSIRCWNGEAVQVLFSLDCCDREVMGWLATSGGVSGEMVRDLMSETLEHRFGPTVLSAPHPIEWLSDNGPCYTARATLRVRAGAGFGGLYHPDLLAGVQRLPFTLHLLDTLRYDAFCESARG
ncbi:MAG: DDE-type integrase/transposase/recombinase, partial [Deltaproteobacteria bacterium]|nr:DDE-type integrase/transposase/recombinase [Deltaproteobacteria bacterium]